MQLLQKRVLFTRQEHLQPFDVTAIVLFGNPQIARCSTLADACEQTGTEPFPSLVAIVDIQAASTKLKNPLQYLNGAAQRPRIGKRTVQLDAPVLRFARDFDAWEILVSGDHQIGKGLVVFQLTIVFWLDVFDQPRFNQQRIDFALALDEIGVGDFLDPRRSPPLGFGSFEKIATCTRPQILRLSHIDDSACLVLEQVNARFLRKSFDFGGGEFELAVFRGLFCFVIC